MEADGLLRLEAGHYFRGLLPSLELLGESGLGAELRAFADGLDRSAPGAEESPLGGDAPASPTRTTSAEAASPAEGAPAGGRTPALDRWLGEFASTGSVLELEERRLLVPAGLQALLTLPGIGIPEARALWRAGISSIPQLRRACLRGGEAAASSVLRLPGIPADLGRALRERLSPSRPDPGYWLRGRLVDALEESAREWSALAGLERIGLAGGLRRGCQLAGRLRWVGCAANPELAIGRLSCRPGATLLGDPPDGARLPGGDGPPQEIFIVEPARFAARLLLETGSRAHLDALLARVAARHPGASAESLGLPDSEEAVYAWAGLPWVPPELREGRGEIAAAAGGRLPRLLAFEDLRGVFHAHTDWSDGRATIAELARAARAAGWSYLGIADHSRSAGYAGGLPPARLLAQAEEVGQAQRAYPGVRLFHGVECDILPDGRLDYPDELLARLDYVIVSIHSGLDADRGAMTARVVRALGHPATTILAHPSGRLLRERAAYALDWGRVLAAAARAGVLVEFNTTPDRYDLDWRLIRPAAALGVRLCINPDAHGLESLAHIPPAVLNARKGWLDPEQVFNTRGREAVEAALRERRARTGKAAAEGSPDRA